VRPEPDRRAGHGGFVSKWYLILAALEKGQWWLVFLIVPRRCWRSPTSGASSRRPISTPPRADLAGGARGAAGLALPAWILVAATIWFGLDTSITVGSASVRRRDAARERAMSADEQLRSSLRSPLPARRRAVISLRRAHAEPARGGDAGDRGAAVRDASPAAARVLAGARPALRAVRVLPGLPIAFAVEPLGMLFALVASGLWIVNSLYSIGYMRGNGEAHQTRFYVCFALAIAAALGIAFSANVFTCSCSTSC
jgi:formate hydrogenlyase subunit 3/multisubunit Na+/H+ antiporter MnhD subunit